jgi:anti-sigma factor RsiW
MMDHAIAQNELQGYLDGTLAPEKSDAVHAHLDGCAACRSELALLREVDQALRAWPVLPEPQGLAERVMASLSLALPPQEAKPKKAPQKATLSALKSWLHARWSEVLLGAVLVTTLVVLVVSARVLGAGEALDLGFWELQVERALATVERAWYAARADAGRGGARGGGVAPGRAGRALAECYALVAGAIVLLAGAVSAAVLAQQWRPIRALLGGRSQGRHGVT